MFPLIILAIIVVLIYHVVKKDGPGANSHGSTTNSAIEESNAMKQGIGFLTDASHLKCNTICSLFVDNSSPYSCSINAIVTLYDVAPYCEPTISSFEQAKKRQINESVQGRITVKDMSTKVDALEEATNKALISSLLGSYQPATYPFSNPREFLKPAQNREDMIIEYPAIVVEPDMSEQRQQIILMLAKKCATIIPDAKISVQGNGAIFTFHT